VSLVDRSQGSILREFSAAISPTVDALVHDNVRESEPFTIESVEVSRILELPKGSKALLCLVTENHTSIESL
jgi:hypothetical protein